MVVDSRIGRTGEAGRLTIEVWDKISDLWSRLGDHVAVGFGWFVVALLGGFAAVFLFALWGEERWLWPRVREILGLKAVAIAAGGIIYIILVPLIGVPWPDIITVWALRGLLGVMVVVFCAAGVVLALEWWFGRAIVSEKPPDFAHATPENLPAGLVMEGIKPGETADDLLSSGPVRGGVNLALAAGFKMLPFGAQMWVVRILFPLMLLGGSALLVYALVRGVP